MAAIFDRNDPASPLAYDASQTALLLLDFHGFCISLCGDEGLQALETAGQLRAWAIQNSITIIHSLIDLAGEIPQTSKGASGLQQMILNVKDDENACKEHPSIASDQEHIVLKRPGIVSNLASEEMQKLLATRGIKSLVICGLSTSGAVLRTAVPATDQGLVVTVVRDACADRTKALHDKLMADVLPSRAHVVTAAELMEKWRPSVK